MQTAFAALRRRLTGTTALTVLAAGALALSGDYAGAVTIGDGVTVVAGTDAAIGGIPGESVTFAATSYIAGSDIGANAILRTTATFSTSRNLIFGVVGGTYGGRIETDADTTLTVSGTITGVGSGNFIKQGAGTLIFTGDGTGFIGTTRVYGGTLVIEGDLGATNASSSAIGNGGNVIVTGAGASWTNYGQIGVGKIGSGSMTISAAAKVFSGNAGSGGTTGGIIGEGGASTVTITGSGSEWATDKTNFYVGHSNAGALTLTYGGTLRVGVGGTGSVLAGISGAGTINIGAAEADAAAAAGTLIAGSVNLAVAGSKIVFNQTTANYIFAPVISGVGTVRQIAGTTVLSAVNTYSGGTVVEEGILRAGVAGALVNDTSFTVNGGELDLNDLNLTMSSLTGTGGEVTIGTAELTVKQAGNTSYAGQLVGSGDFNKTGIGNLLLTGDSSAFTGTTTVSGGGLFVGNTPSGKLGGDIDIEIGARLGGTGSVGSTGKTVEIKAGGTHAPGNSIGTQTVDGNYVNNGILEIEANPTEADRIVVNGTVDVTGADLQLVLKPDTAESWDLLTGPYVIIDNDSTDAVIGEFDPINSDQPFLDALINYAGGTGNDVTMQLVRNDVDFVDVAETRNQRATAGAVDTLDVTSEVWMALALAGSGEEARALLDQLSGEVHASIAGMFTQDSRFWRNAANDRLRSAFGSVAATGQQVMGFGATGLTNAPADAQGLVLWTRGFGSWARTDSDGNAADFTRSTGGLLAGADMAVGDAARLGVLAGYARSSFDADDRDSSGDADSYQFGLYGGTRIDAVGLRAGVAYARHEVDTERHALGDKLTAEYDAGTAQVFGEAGYAIDLDSVRFEPFANAAYVSTRTDDFEEDGGPAALSSDAETTDNTFTTLGVRAAAAFDLGDLPAAFRAMAGWRHVFGDVRPEATFAFEGSEDFVIAGAPIARDAAVLEAGFDLSLSPDAMLGIAYSGEIADDAQDHGVNATLAVEF